MTPERLRAIGVRLYGPDWQQPMAKALQVNPSTIWRWETGAVPVPGPAQAALKCFLREKTGQPRRRP